MLYLALFLPYFEIIFLSPPHLSCSPGCTQGHLHMITWGSQ